MADYSNLLAGNVEKQKLRTAAGGLTFNMADEAEAALRSMFSNRPYEEVLAELQQKLEAYKQAYPGEALAYEMGGAVAPAAAGLIAAPFTGGTSATAATPLLAKVATQLGLKNPKNLMEVLTSGFTQGALSGYGAGEGGMLSGDRFENALQSGIMGTAFSAGLEGAAQMGKPVFVGLLDVARRKFGAQVGGRVEAEIQRIAQEMGLDENEVAQMIIDGRILADNKTIAEMVRGYRAGSEAASEMAERRLRLRPQQKQSELISKTEEYLGGIQGSTGPSVTGNRVNILAQMTEELTQLKDKADNLYNGAWADNPVDTPTFELIRDLYSRNKDAFKEVNETRAADGLPLIRIKDGQVEMPNTITIREAEEIRKALANSADRAWDRSAGTTAKAYSRLEKMLRNRIDNLSDETREARQTYYQMMTKGDAFDAGQKVWSANPDADMLEITMAEAIAKGGEEGLRAFRLGVLTKLRSQLKNNPTGTSKKILNDETTAATAFNMIFPEQNKAEILAMMQNQKDAQEAVNLILGSSPTAITDAYRRRQGTDISMADMSLDAMAIATLGMKLLNKMRPDFSDSEKRQIVDILTSSDPERVRRVLRDRGGLSNLVAVMDTIYEQGVKGARRAGTQYIGSDPQGALQQTYDYMNNDLERR